MNETTNTVPVPAPVPEPVSTGLVVTEPVSEQVSAPTNLSLHVNELFQTFTNSKDFTGLQKGYQFYSLIMQILIYAQTTLNDPKHNLTLEDRRLLLKGLLLRGNLVCFKDNSDYKNFINSLFDKGTTNSTNLPALVLQLMNIIQTCINSGATMSPHVKHDFVINSVTCLLSFTALTPEQQKELVLTAEILIDSYVLVKNGALGKTVKAKCTSCFGKLFN